MAGTCPKETKIYRKSRLGDTLGMEDYTHWLRQGKASSQSTNQPIHCGLSLSSVSVKGVSTKRELHIEERQAVWAHPESGQLELSHLLQGTGKEPLLHDRYTPNLQPGR